MSTPTILWGATLLEGFDPAGQPILHADAGILIRDGVIARLGPVEELRAASPEAVVEGGPRFAITPGFVNAHHHVGLTPLQLGSPIIRSNSGSPRVWRCATSIWSWTRSIQPSR